jgi:hypothetical protein
MCPRGPMKPPQVLVKGVLVVWRTRIDRLPHPVLPQLDELIAHHAPILLGEPLPVVHPVRIR